MNDDERHVLRIHHTTLLETLDTKFMIPFLYEKGIDFEENCFDNKLARPERVNNMLLSLKDKCHFDLFIECLRHDDSYPYIADDLEKELESVDSCNGTVHNQRKVHLFTDRRQNVSDFRHKMKRCSHEKDFDTFRECYDKAIGDWEYVNNHRIKFNQQQRQKAADFCHAAYDAEIERRRVFYEKTPLKGDVLDELLRMCAHTSLPIASDTLFLARYSSALVMAGGSLEEGLTYIEDAEHKMALLPACRETGLVLYIKFNFLLLKHERDRTRIDKEELSKLGNSVISHFSTESDTISNDFKRIFLLKKAHTCLDMGVFLNVIGEFEVRDVHIEEAERLLNELHRPELWERMELRAKMVYTAIRSRLAQLKDPERPAEAIKLAKKSLQFAKRGHFPKEQKAIDYNLSLLSGKQNA
ncbi:uncharacterized protein LOC110447757 isoform X2 [Mizuhopecten yessoensis]|uniref:CARD domain-containing protein n=2 Tax=Mizuhopecten yessoensis TaxID=6573 RepID=A0A210QUN0_MIZYE|nr:uncharacterized protein LOC110447757 isoform X2 [Mizuhopecten yessoensis]OWF52439.1 hypothetical protein KP79_PYT12255 [Mizuhopecten yessoensis]